MSSPVRPATKCDDEKKQRRRLICRRAKRRQREREHAFGDVKIEVRLTSEQWAAIEACRALQRGDEKTFIVRALMTGARFMANSGTPKGKKAAPAQAS
mgnify:CR=1 FL=1